MQRTSTPIRAERLLLVVLTAWALAMIVPGFYRVFDPLNSFGLSVNNDGVVVDVVSPFEDAAHSPAAAAGIVPGDRIDLLRMRCIPLGNPECGTVLTLLGGLGGMQSVLPNRQITLVVNPASSASPRTFALQSAPAPLSTAERLVLLADTIVGVIAVVSVCWLVWKRPCRMTWGLFLYVIWFNPGQSYAYYALLQLWPGAILVQELAEAAAQGAAFFGLASFALRFPHDRTEPPWQPLERALPLLGVAMTLLMLMSFGSAFGFRTETITEATFLIGYAIDAGVLFILLKRRRALPKVEEQRMRWVIWGCAIGLPAYILAEIGQSATLLPRVLGISLSPAVIGLLYLPNGVLAYFASEAVRKQRVVSVSIPLRHGTILTCLSLAVAVPTVRLHEAMSQYQESLHLPGWVWLFVVAPVLLKVLDRLHEFGVELVDHVFSRRFHIAQLGLEEAAQRIQNAKSLEEIDRMLVTAPARVLSLSSGAVFRNENGVFRRTEHTPDWESAERELRHESHEFALSSIDTGAPVRISHIDSERHTFPKGLAAPCLSVPVSSQAHDAIAVVLYGAHLTGNDIDLDECEMLAKLAERAAIGYERVHTAMLRQEVARLRTQLAALRTAS